MRTAKSDDQLVCLARLARRCFELKVLKLCENCAGPGLIIAKHDWRMRTTQRQTPGARAGGVGVVGEDPPRSGN